MKIAIPMFHTKISPRFDQAQGFLLLEIENAGVIARENLNTKDWSVLSKMKYLVALGVDTLICGGIDRASLQYLNARGLNIYSWVTGEAEDAVSCFLSNRMKPGIILGAHGKMDRRWQFCRGRNHLCNLFQTGIYDKQVEVRTMPRGDGTGPRGQGPRSGMGRGGCTPGKRGRKNGRGGRQGSDRGRGGGVKDRRKSDDDKPQPQQRLGKQPAR